MAGIGFTLRKVITKGSMTSFLKAAFSGIMVVSGPWILSIIALSIISTGIGSTTREMYNLFLAINIYSYAVGLILFSSIHYGFTRLIADMIWEKKEHQASNYLLQLLLVVFMLSVGIAYLLFGIQDFSFLPNGELFTFSAMLFFVSINLLWIVMLFVSLLKWYVRVLIIYFVGLAISVFSIIIFEPELGIAGSILGFALGHFFIVIALLLLSLLAYPPKKAGIMWPSFFIYFKKYRLLILNALFFYATLWGDKIYYWFVQGTPVQNTWFLLSPSYDVAVFFANLSIIPGLVYFVILGETEFYTSFRRFLIALSSKPYIDIQRSKFKLLNSLKTELLRQSFLHGMIALCLILFSNTLPFFGKISNPQLFSIATIGVFFQLLTTTLSNYYYYFEEYKRPAQGALIYFILTLSLNTILTLIPSPQWLAFLSKPGIGIAVSGAVASLFLIRHIMEDAKKIDRIILSRYST